MSTVSASPVATGLGMVRSAHGLLPNPAPAVVELLEGIPTEGRDVERRADDADGCGDAGRLGLDVRADAGDDDRVDRLRGRGARAGRPAELHPGRDRPARRSRSGASSFGEGQQLVQLEANLDDVTGETLAHAVAALLDDGALDAWVTPVLMKKGRPGHVVSVLCDPVLVGDLRRRLERETGSLGVRAHSVERWAARRELLEVEVDGYPMRVKVSPGRVKVEHADAARVAGRDGTPRARGCGPGGGRLASAGRRATSRRPTVRPGSGSPITPLRP